MPAGSQGVEDLGFGVSKRTHGRLDGFGEVSQNRRIQRVGLGQLPGGPGKVPHLAGVDDDHGQSVRCPGRHQRHLQAPRSLQQDQDGIQGFSRETSFRIPASSRETSHLSPVGRTATST